MTREMIVETLKAIEINSRQIAESYRKDGDYEKAKRENARANGYWTAIQMLTDDSYAKDMKRIFIDDCFNNAV